MPCAADCVAYSSYRQRLCARRIDWLVRTIYKKTIKRYQTQAAQLSAGIRAPRRTFRAPASRAVIVAPSTAVRAEYNPAPDAGARKRKTVAEELELLTTLIERAKAKGVADDDIASAIHAANNSLEFSLGADRIAKRPRLGVNPQAVAGASRKRAVRPGEPLRAGQRAVPRLTKTNGGKDKKRAKLTVVVNGPLTEKDTQAAEVAKKTSAAKAAQLAASGRVSATFAATAGAACASARVKRKASGA